MQASRLIRGPEGIVGSVLNRLEVDHDRIEHPPPLGGLAPGFSFCESTWTLGLDPIEGARTRLVKRVRARVAPTVRGICLLLLRDPGQFLMERKMLLGIKRRAEGYRRVPARCRRSARP
jgi:hypothetical protein